MSAQKLIPEFTQTSAHRGGDIRRLVAAPLIEDKRQFHKLTVKFVELSKQGGDIFRGHGVKQVWNGAVRPPLA